MSAVRLRGRQPRADQAVRGARSRSTPSTWRCRAAQSTASSARTAPARPPPSGCCSGWSGPPPAAHALLGAADARGGRRVLPRVGALVEGPAFHPYLSGPGQPAPAGRGRPHRRPAPPRTPRIAAALDRVGLTAAAGKRYRRLLAGHAAAAGARRGPAAPARAARSWTSRPTGSTRRAPARCASLISALAADGATVMLSTHLLSEVEQICTHVGVMHLGRLVAQAPLAELRGAAAPRARVDTDRAGRRRPGADASSGSPTCAAGRRRGDRGLLGALAPEKVVAALVHAGVPVRGFGVRRARPGGAVRLADRGGLRCQRLRRTARRARAAVRARLTPPGRYPVPALRAVADLRPPAQLGRAGRAGRVPVIIAIAVRSSDRPRPAAAAGRTSSPRSPATGCFVALAALTVELPLFLPLAVAAIAGDAVAGEANLGTLRYLLTVPVDRTRLLAGQVRRHRDLRARRDRCWSPWSGSVIGLALFGGGPVTLLSGTQVELRRGAAAAAARSARYIAVGLCALGAIGLFVSTLTEQPIGATIAIVMVHRDQLHPGHDPAAGLAASRTCSPLVDGVRRTCCATRSAAGRVRAPGCSRRGVHG